MIFKPYDYLVVAYLLLAPFVLISVTWAIERNKEKRVSRLRFKDDLPDVPADSEQLGRAWFLKSRRMWFVVVCYELLTTAGIALFYFSPRVVASRVRRDLANSGFSQPIDIHISGGVATLTGQVATPHLATALSRRTAEIVGPNHVINRLQVEGPEILGSLVEPLGEAQVVVDTSYDDSPQSLREIGAILNLPQYETIQVGRGTRMPGLIAKRFRIVRSRLPKSYSMLAAGISTLNRLERPADLRPGTLKLPILPPRYAGPRLRLGRRGQRQKSGLVDLVGALDSVGISRSLRPIGSSRVVLNIPFTRESAGQTQRAASVLPFSVLRSNMRINFAAGSSSRVLHDALSQGDKDAIVQALKQEKQRDATVFILDTGWPDETQYNTSLTELRRLIDFENKWYGLDPVTWERPRKFTDLSSDNPPKHCVEIMQALQEFTDLDREVASQKHRDPKVKVVYVPLSRKQKSDQILMELLKLSWVRQEAINDHPLTGDRLRKLSDGATAYANVVLKNLDPNGIDEPDFPKSEKEKDSYQQTWKTDSAIVTAVWYLADWASYTNSERPVYFLNESWTVLPDTIHLLSPAKSYGIVVAAVGEDYGVQINDGKNDKEFARLAAPANNVLAALDAKQTSDESDCDSNSVVEDKLSNTMAASFDGSVIEGKIVDGGVCGTSFSAPRIAWILALSEAIRANEKLKEDWADSIQQKLLRARRQDATHQWQKLYLHPGSILP